MYCAFYFSDSFQRFVIWRVLHVSVEAHACSILCFNNFFSLAFCKSDTIKDISIEWWLFCVGCRPTKTTQIQINQQKQIGTIIINKFAIAALHLNVNRIEWFWCDISAIRILRFEWMLTLYLDSWAIEKVILPLVNSILNCNGKRDRDGKRKREGDKYSRAG